MTRRKAYGVGLVTLAAIAVVGLGLPAVATAPGVVSPLGKELKPIPLGGWITKKAAMPGTGPAVWTELAGPTARKWQPRGSVIADSGFRPAKDGYFFLNYGNYGAEFPNQVNNYIFKTSLRAVANMGSKQMIGLFGAKQVCHGNVSKGGTCVLTLAARQWMDAANTESDGGHCFGMATTAAQIYDGMRSASSFGAPTPHKVGFAPKATSQIAQSFATQELVDLPTLTPSRALPKLVKALRNGSAPYTLSIRDNTGGGHAITPIAIYDRGHGKYDIAVYDNNYPDRVRAIHADTRAKVTADYAGFKYELFTIPGAPPVDMVGNISLVPVKSLLPNGNFTCPFCSGAATTTVKIAPAVTDVPVNVQVTSPTGSPIPGLKVRYPTNPWRPGQARSFPKFEVPKGVAFKVTIDNGANPATLNTAVLVTTGEVSTELSSYALPAGSIDHFSLTPTTGEIAFVTSRGSDPVLSVLDDTAANEYQAVVESIDLAPGGGFKAALDQGSHVFSFAPPAGDDQVLMEVVQGGDVGGSAVINSGTAGLALPSDGSLRWNYGDWKLQATSTTVQLLTAAGSLATTTTISTTPAKQ